MQKYEIASNDRHFAIAAKRSEGEENRFF